MIHSPVEGVFHMKGFRFAILILFALCVSSAVLKSDNTQVEERKAHPCRSMPEYRQFDFWVGEWDVTERGKPAGKSSIQLILDDCIIFENWTGASGYSGKSFNLYNARAGKWQQKWVDSSGQIIEFEGGLKDGAMILIGDGFDNDGKKVLTRMTFTNPNKEHVRQVWDQSADNGKTWAVLFDGNYTRKKD